MSSGPDIGGVAANLRAAFDGAFGEEPAERGERPAAFLHIGVAGQDYLVALAEIAGIQPLGEAAPIPSSAPELLGMAGVHGEPVPVFGLAALLGLDRGGEAPRWLMLAGDRERLAFAFDRLEGYRGLAPADISKGAGPEAEHLRGTGLVDGVRRPILRLEALREQLAARQDRSTD